MPHDRGNILFLILLAIILFAALTYAVSGSLRVKDDGMSKEAADSAAADIINWFAQVDTAIMRMRLVNDYKVEEIDFYDPRNKNQDGSSISFNNEDYCTTPACQVFSPNGGNATSRFFEQYAVDVSTSPSSRMPGHHDYQVVKVANLGTSLNDVVMRVDFIKLAVCKAVNRKLGLPECPNVNTTGGRVGYSGSASQIDNALASGSNYNSGGDIAGQHTWCGCSAGTNYGYVNHVVIER